jgi:hypothetical protein
MSYSLGVALMGTSWRSPASAPSRSPWSKACPSSGVNDHSTGHDLTPAEPEIPSPPLESGEPAPQTSRTQQNAWHHGGDVINTIDIETHDESSLVVTDIGPHPQAMSEALIGMEVTVCGRACPVHFALNTDTVEVCRPGDPGERFARCDVRAWLVAPTGPLASGDVVFTTDGEARPALSLPGVGVWTLAPAVLSDLRRFV